MSTSEILSELNKLPEDEVITIELTDVVVPRRALSAWQGVVRAFQLVDDGKVRVRGEMSGFRGTRFASVEFTQTADVLAGVMRSLERWRVVSNR